MKNIYAQFKVLKYKKCNKTYTIKQKFFIILKAHKFHFKFRVTLFKQKLRPTFHYIF
jgi:hypothetical protein